MNDFILKLLAKYLNGYKTYIGTAGKALAGCVSIITGVLGLIGNMYPDMGFEALTTEAAVGLIGAGFYAISSAFQGLGVAHKIEKAKI